MEPPHRGQLYPDFDRVFQALSGGGDCVGVGGAGEGESYKSSVHVNSQVITHQGSANRNVPGVYVGLALDTVIPAAAHANISSAYSGQL